VAAKILSTVFRPVALPGQELRATASIGISRFPQDGADEQTSMKNADIAMYQAKEAGRNGFGFYDADRDANSFERLAMESRLRRAMEHQELVIHYQPKSDFRSGAISGMEALLRWQHPELGMVSPTKFIPLAEETGLIVPIDTLKIDRSFIRDLETDEEDRGLTEAIISLGKTLKLHLVAEGVETREQASFLHNRGCDELQGVYFSKPGPSDEFEDFVKSHRASLGTEIVSDTDFGGLPALLPNARANRVAPATAARGS
jgi:predicted signal transduction protein with EAL and GGDEF domain